MANKSGGMPPGLRTAMFWVLGIGIIAFILLILVIIFGNLSGNVGFGQDSTSAVNETITMSSDGATPSTALNRGNGLISSVVMVNATGNETVTQSGNFSISGVLIISTDGGDYNNTDVKVSYDLAFDSKGKPLYLFP